MYPVRKLHALLIIILIAGFSELANAQKAVPFTFTLSADATTSAGVFAKDGTLLRTLWGGVSYTAGTYTMSWDGTTDDGVLVGSGNYDIRVLSNNVSYTWEGVLGNTSTSFTGPSVYRAYLRMFSMAITGSTAYASSYYNEGNSSQLKFDISNPNATRVEISTFGQATMFVATDGQKVYWAGDDALGGHTKWFMFASNISDDNDYTFSTGSAVQPLNGRVYGSSVDITNGLNTNITGLAVQKNGQYIFLSHQNLNEIHVLDKTSGALVQTISSTSPTKLAIDGNDNLWVMNQSNNTVNKYTVNSNGTLSSAVLTISGPIDPVSLAISPDNSTVVIGDGSPASQQLKAYSTTTGSPSWTFGQAGGYYTDATVQNDKLYLTDVRGNHDGNFVAFQPDGSFWVEDGGNYRTQLFSASRTYIDNLMYFPSFYSTFVDPNNPSRVFGDYLEFSIDYTKSLSPTNGSWTLVKNWGANVPDYKDVMNKRMYDVTTLSNGRTYALFIDHNNNDNFEIAELPATGQLRFSGNEISSFYTGLYADGSLRMQSALTYGTPTVFYKRPLTGFDASNNPVWGATTTIATTPPTSDQDPVYHGNGVFHAGEITSSNVVVSFDNGIPSTGGGSGYHLGGINLNDNKWLWRTSKSTYTSYNGPFPSDGGYDIGNGVNYGGSVVIASDRNIFWGYHGEFWKASQTNYWDHFYDDGLFVGQMGTFGKGEALFGMAGNALNANIVKDAAGNLYLYHNDEGGHGGIHRWKISNLNSIQEQTIGITFSSVNGGLLSRYYDGSDLNNFNVKRTRIETNVSVDSVPSQIPNTSNFSARWSGFVQPMYSENYTFYANTNNKVRLWVDDNLIIDQWGNTGTNEFASSSVALTAGQPYAIRVDYANTTGGKNVNVSWSSASQSKQIIPSARLYPADLPDTGNGIDLLEGLPKHSVLSNNMYGWSRNQDEDTSGPSYQKWWDIKTSNEVYSPTASPDVHGVFVQQSGNYTINRDLGTPNPLMDSWKLSGHISYENDALISWTGESYGGNFFMVQDDQGKIIVRFETYIDYSSGISYIVINHTLLASANTDSIQSIHRTIQPIEISAFNGNITIKYGPFAPVTTTAFDITSNWINPKTMQLLLYSNGSNNTQTADIVDMRYSITTNSLLPATLLNLKAENEENSVNVSWNTSNEINTETFGIERSIDGTSFINIGNTDAKNAPGAQQYNFIDGRPLNGTSYYRLKLTDVNGSYTYSPAVSVTRKASLTFNVYPNPVQNSLQVNYPAVNGSGWLDIITADGRDITKSQLQKGNSTVLLDVKSLTPGIYVLRFKDDLSTKITTFVKQ